jgi:hypothetical protein
MLGFKADRISSWMDGGIAARGCEPSIVTSLHGRARFMAGVCALPVDEKVAAKQRASAKEETLLQNMPFLHVES